MFLNVTKRRNPELIKTGVMLHQGGSIPPNTYIVDVDILKENTTKLVKTATTHGLELYFMSKQLGRFPALANIIVEAGLKKAVPEVVTIFSYERAKQLSDTAERLGIRQDVLIKVFSDEDKIYPGQEGGIHLHDLPPVIDKMMTLKGIKIVGVTAFPNLQINDAHTKMVPTPNLATVLKARDVLIDKGITVKQVNGPSGTSCETIPFLAEQGVTHGEPGHGLTGTTPLHAVRDLPEKPAMIYVSEVSHQYKNQYEVIAGGYYGRSNMEGTFVGHDPETILSRYVKAYPHSPEAIDYYGAIETPKDFSIDIGDTAIFAFRTQIFVTRAHVALVEGIQSGNPRIIHFERKW